MAKIKFGLVATAASGKSDGVVFSHNRNGPYVRPYRVPVNPRTPRQQQVRSQLSFCAQAWRNLTASQRNAWEALATTNPQVDSLGTTFYLTGSQQFTSLNQLRLTGGQAIQNTAPILDQAPLMTGLSAVASFTTTGSVTTVTVTFTLTGATTSTFRIYSTGPISAGISFVGDSEYRLLSSFPGTQTSPVSVTTAYTSIYGSLTAALAGAKISFKIVPVSPNSIPGPPTRVDTIITTI